MGVAMRVNRQEDGRSVDRNVPLARRGSVTLENLPKRRCVDLFSIKIGAALVDESSATRPGALRLALIMSRLDWGMGKFPTRATIKNR